MKNILKKCLILFSVAIAFAMGTVSYAADAIRSSTIQEYNGTTYSTLKYWSIVVVADESVTELPYSIVASTFEEQQGENHIYSFIIYNDRIYYVKGSYGCEPSVLRMYSSNLDGSDIRLIADNVDSGDFFILNDCVYYEVFYDYYNSYGRYLNGGIMKINLNTGEYAKLVTDKYSVLINVVGDNVFYGVGKTNMYNGDNESTCHLMKTDGRYVGQVSKDDIEISTIIDGAVGYYGYNGAIFSRDWNGKIRWICDIPKFVDGARASEKPIFENVSGGNIYYSVGTVRHEKDETDMVLMKVPITGGESKLIGKWYIP